MFTLYTTTSTLFFFHYCFTERHHFFCVCLQWYTLTDGKRSAPLNTYCLGKIKETGECVVPVESNDLIFEVYDFLRKNCSSYNDDFFTTSTLCNGGPLCEICRFLPTRFLKKIRILPAAGECNNFRPRSPIFFVKSTNRTKTIFLPEVTSATLQHLAKFEGSPMNAF